MSVSGMIHNPRNEEEASFFFPIATERVYSEYWIKFAERNNFFWMKSFLYGIVVEEVFFKDILFEITSFKDYLMSDQDLFYMDEKEYILERIHLFVKKLDEAKNIRDDIELYIG